VPGIRQVLAAGPHVLISADGPLIAELLIAELLIAELLISELLISGPRGRAFQSRHLPRKYLQVR
jgi:hypothetical protein